MKGRFPLRWRHLRWAVVGAALPALWACTSRTLQPPQPAPKRTISYTYQESLNQNVDILFVIDSSTSMRPLQAKLRANFSTFMQVLQNLPSGLPSIHIGVVTTDLGAGPFTEIPQCTPDGKKGELQNLPGPLAEAGCSGPDGKYISDETSAGGTANYTGDLSAVFSCIAAVGDTGCGFEHQLGAAMKALDPANAANAGFVRPGAYLAIVFVTNEDDCTARDGRIFDPNSRSVTDTFGALTSFRCNEYGHICGGAPPPRTGGTFPDCVSNENGMLLPVADAVAFIKSLKADPSKILVSAIAGPATPYEVEVLSVTNPSTMQTENQPAIRHSCTEATADPAMPEYADPGVRLSQFVSAFGRNGLYMPICAASFAPALQRIAEEIGRVLGPKCVNGVVANRTAPDGTPVPDCQVADRTLSADGSRYEETSIPSCIESGNNPPCWNLVDGDATTCTGAKRMDVQRPGGGQAPPDTNISVGCALCVPGVASPGCP